MSHTITHEIVDERSLSCFILPDLISDCPYPILLNSHHYHVSHASEQWLLQGAQLVEPHITKFMGLKAGELAAACYPDADIFHLRVCSDFLNWLFNMDDWLDEFNVLNTWGMRACCIDAFRDPINFQTDNLVASMSKSSVLFSLLLPGVETLTWNRDRFFSRFIQTSGPRCKKRFIDTMELFFAAVAKQADDRLNGCVPDLESYVNLRRNTSGCKASFTLIEYATGIDLPNEVMSHPLIMDMVEATNDFVSWSNDLFSYNVEQARHDTHNMVAVLMHEHGLDLQSAADYVGTLCKGNIQRFEETRAMLPSWGEELDREVAIFVEGLRNWIVGTLHWSFDSERYFGKEGLQVKQNRIIRLLPKLASYS